MNTHTSRRLWPWMAGAVALHLAISLVHGAAHDGAHVPLTPAANLFVLVVILAGPVAGLLLSWRFARLGSLIVGLTLAGSLIFGVVNHFVLDSPDHVRAVAAQWQMLFGATAVLLAVTEALGLGVAFRLAGGGRP